MTSPEARNRYDIFLGVPFKPFEGMQRWHQESINGRLPKIPERYDYYLYLRRKIGLYGINGVVDVISEEPMSIISTWAVIARNFRVFMDSPMGPVEDECRFHNGKFEPVKVPAILRVSFRPTTPNEYAKLLCTYVDVDMGSERFLLIFNLNKQAIKRKFKSLKGGKGVWVAEKNLFSYVNIEKLDRETKDEEDGDENPKDYDSPKGDPGRIAFVRLPIDIEKFRGIQMTFHRMYDGGEREYPTEPILPNQQPLPILVTA